MIRPLLRVVAKTDLREVFTAFALLVVAGVAELMAIAGVSMALGAFLAGVLLASSEYRHALETDIEPFKGLLMGLFFIAVGMSIDFGLLARGPLLKLRPYFGRTSQFPLATSIPVKKGQVIAITVPTWAPALGTGLGGDTSWRASREKGAVLHVLRPNGEVDFVVLRGQ